MIFLCVMVRLLFTRVFGSFPPRAKEAIPHAETRCFEDGVGAPFADGVFAAPAAFYGLWSRRDAHARLPPPARHDLHVETHPDV